MSNLKPCVGCPEVLKTVFCLTVLKLAYTVILQGNMWASPNVSIFTSSGLGMGPPKPMNYYSRLTKVTDAHILSLRFIGNQFTNFPIMN
jgi:hypothetical protein